MRLSEVTCPVFIVSHKDDGCSLSPSGDISLLAERFTSSSRVEKTLFSGGSTPISDSCDALSEHGFLGIEHAVVNSISSFIEKK